MQTSRSIKYFHLRFAPACLGAGLGVVAGAPIVSADNLHLAPLEIMAPKDVAVPQEPATIATRVIGGEEIERQQIRRLDDALGLVPGPSLSGRQAPGGVQTVRLRGPGPRNTRVFIDGVDIVTRRPSGPLAGQVGGEYGGFDSKARRATRSIRSLPASAGPRGPRCTVSWGPTAHRGAGACGCSTARETSR